MTQFIQQRSSIFDFPFLTSYDTIQFESWPISKDLSLHLIPAQVDGVLSRPEGHGLLLELVRTGSRPAKLVLPVRDVACFPGRLQGGCSLLQQWLLLLVLELLWVLPLLLMRVDLVLAGRPVGRVGRLADSVLVDVLVQDLEYRMVR